uniref:Putative ribonuclease H-like domain-containing protein n=1 Tax=Tanacetum cinerariifolium TaxID=118510 RepID=A0A6L2JPJ0_TANCI|nr:putative ribonuclease H-like domain-containing protein [Tanacetum cinerariifolium]
MRPFRCHVTILNTIDNLGKFDLMKSSNNDRSKPSSVDGNKVEEDLRKENESNDQEKKDNVNSTNNVNTISLTIRTASINKVNDVGKNIIIKLLFNLNMPALKDVSTFDFSRDDEDDDVVDGMNDLDTTIQVSPTPTTRIHKDHPHNQVIRDNGFQRGKIDKTLFVKRHKGDILLVQVYVDDIIFGSTKKELCLAFEKLMHEKFQMSSRENLHSSWDKK